jgi:hypothetical protein
MRTYRSLVHIHLEEDHVAVFWQGSHGLPDKDDLKKSKFLRVMDDIRTRPPAMQIIHPNSSREYVKCQSSQFGIRKLYK